MHGSRGRVPIPRADVPVSEASTLTQSVPECPAVVSTRPAHLTSSGVSLTPRQVLSGDFHQLPPVAKGAAAAGRRFAFEAASWRRCVDACFQLTTVYRQV